LSHAVIPSDERSEESRDPYPCERSLMLSSRATSAARSRGTTTLRMLSHAVIPSDEVAGATEESRDPYSANALSRCHPERRAQRGVEGPAFLSTIHYPLSTAFKSFSNRSNPL